MSVNVRPPQRWTPRSSKVCKKNCKNYDRKKRPTSVRRASPSSWEYGDGEDKSGGWNTLYGISSSGEDPRSRDGWVSEDPEPSPPPPGQPDEYERDASGRLVYMPRGFYYDAVRRDAVGNRIKIDVGIVGSRKSRTFMLRKVLSSSSSSSSASTTAGSGPASDIFSVTMERPLGIVFERDTEGMVRVADFVEGSRAGRAAAVDRLQSSYNANVSSSSSSSTDGGGGLSLIHI